MAPASPHPSSLSKGTGIPVSRGIPWPKQSPAKRATKSLTLSVQVTCWLPFPQRSAAQRLVLCQLDLYPRFLAPPETIWIPKCDAVTNSLHLPWNFGQFCVSSIRGDINVSISSLLWRIAKATRLPQFMSTAPAHYAEGHRHLAEKIDISGGRWLITWALRIVQVVNGASLSVLNNVFPQPSLSWIFHNTMITKRWRDIAFGRLKQLKLMQR